MNIKYEIIETDFKINVLGVKVFRIKAKTSFLSVKEGDLGGYVEKEENLSYSGDAWVCGNAWVFGNAKVSGNALVYGEARVSGIALVSGDAQVSGNARVSGDAHVYGAAQVSGEARVSGNALVYGDARVSGNALVSGDAQVSGNARVSGDAHVYGAARVNKSPITISNYCKWSITATETHLHVGCKVKTKKEWLSWLDGEEEFETKRDTEEFRLIEKAIRFLCE